ncbi:MAG: AraC family transcriptional regulator [Clostridiales bacterium]|nr:AraC family transcriptional regulator [Clostridiales bacterium]
MTTFAEEYQRSLSITPEPAAGEPVLSGGVFYELLEEAARRLPTILYGGSVEIASSYTFACQPLEGHLLLYTREGSGRLRLCNKVWSLEAGTLLYLDCGAASFTLQPALFPWRFTLFLVRGALFADYDTLVPFDGALLHPLPPYSPILKDLDRLLSAGTAAKLHHKLTHAAILTNLMTELWAKAYDLRQEEESAPFWLLEIRQELDSSFTEPFCLEDLEKRYHKSKYRICREFSASFGLPPLKYLNHKRLQAAEDLLLSTEKRVHEIALEVGYENTNHFINLFKKEYGATPQAYRMARQK